MFLISSLVLLAICTHNALSQEGKCGHKCIKSVEKCKNETSDECKDDFHFFIKCITTCSSSDYKEFEINFKPSENDMNFGFPLEFIKKMETKFNEHFKNLKESVSKLQDHVDSVIAEYNSDTFDNDENFYKQFIQSTKDSLEKHNYFDAVHTLFNPIILPAKVSNLFYDHFLKKRSAQVSSLIPYPYDMAQEYVLSKRIMNLCNHKRACNECPVSRPATTLTGLGSVDPP
ncbi:hypothetical protein O3M35_007423 [Rhynocoris fuscipes]|uniref:Uncharacterized protein n=1 Tax=Rhynocoris fuscipes TaxID=488301 RepID=A0AAW1DEN6_9HEMI